MTSYCFGQRTSCMAQLSASTCSSATSEYSSLPILVTTWFHSTPDFITLRFSAEATFLPRVRARSKATRAMRSISWVV